VYLGYISLLGIIPGNISTCDQPMTCLSKVEYEIPIRLWKDDKGRICSKDIFAAEPFICVKIGVQSGVFCIAWKDQIDNIAYKFVITPNEPFRNSAFRSDKCIPNAGQYRYGLWLYDVDCELVMLNIGQKCKTCKIDMPHVALDINVMCKSCKALEALDAMV
jgi:hypothetical protein